MGPHLGRCGNTGLVTALAGKVRLQWDRTSEGAEIRLTIYNIGDALVGFNGTAPRKVRKSSDVRYWGDR